MLYYLTFSKTIYIGYLPATEKPSRRLSQSFVGWRADSPWRVSSSAISEFFAILFDMRIRINRSFLISLCVHLNPMFRLLEVFNIARGGQRDKELIVPQQNRLSSSANLEPRCRQLTLPRFVPLAEVFYDRRSE